MVSRSRCFRSASFFWFDLDGDRDQDALAIQSSGELRLLRNQGEEVQRMRLDLVADELNIIRP